eukprot:157629-Pyramimonas_sp.AAC.1
MMTKLQANRYALGDGVDNASKPELEGYIPAFTVPGAKKIIEICKQAEEKTNLALPKGCLLYTSDAADDTPC